MSSRIRIHCNAYSGFVSASERKVIDRHRRKVNAIPTARTARRLAKKNEGTKQ